MHCNNLMTVEMHPVQRSRRICLSRTKRSLLTLRSELGKVNFSRSSLVPVNLRMRAQTTCSIVARLPDYSAPSDILPAVFRRLRWLIFAHSSIQRTSIAVRTMDTYLSFRYHVSLMQIVSYHAHITDSMGAYRTDGFWTCGRHPYGLLFSLDLGTLIFIILWITI